MFVTEIVFAEMTTTGFLNYRPEMHLWRAAAELAVGGRKYVGRSDGLERQH